MGIGAIRLSNGYHEAMLDENSCRDQLEHTEEVGMEAVELADVEEAEYFISDSEGEGSDDIYEDINYYDDDEQVI